MILNKDLQDILEGMYYYLSELLPQERLSGRAECMRRGLLVQLQALPPLYPSLKIHPPTHPPITPNQSGGGGGGAIGGGGNIGSTLSLPYLPMESNGRGTATTTATPYSSSISSSSSTGGSSGDGQVGGMVRPALPAPPTQEERGEEEEEEEVEEIYEEFDEIKDDGFEIIPEGGREGGGFGAGGGGGRGEKEEEEGVYTESHEPVSFSSLIASCERHGVLAKRTKGLLRTLKTYQCVAVNGLLYLYLRDTDDRQRKTIDLCGYVARPALGEDGKDAKKSRAAFELVCPAKKTHSFIAKTTKDKQEWIEAITRTITTTTTRTKPPQAPVHSHTTTHPMPSFPRSFASPPLVSVGGVGGGREEERGGGEAREMYDDIEVEELYEEIEGELVGETLPPPPASLLHPSSFSSSSTPPPSSSIITSYDMIEGDLAPPHSSAPPRPPPPMRPPPPQHSPRKEEKIKEQEEREEEEEDIYTQIDDDDLENIHKAHKGDFFNLGMVGGVASPTIANTPVSSFVSGEVGAGLGSLGKEIFSTLNEGKKKIAAEIPTSLPPLLPPKGIPLPQAEESEYNVPQGSDGEYHIPSSPPVPVTGQKQTDISNISSPVTSPVIKVIPSESFLPIKPLVRKGSVAEERKPQVSSFRSGEHNNPPRSSKVSSGSSVKDLIAKLNQKNSVTKKEEEEEKTVPSLSSSSSSSSSSSMKTEKPPLPQRPSNLTPTPLPLPEEQEEVIEEEIYNDIEEEGDGEDLEVEEQGEWYVAKFAFVATLDQALSFGRGQEVLVFDTSGASGWWRASVGGRKGLVPREYLRRKT